MEATKSTDPENISRGIPEISVLVDAILKYDSNTADLLEDYKDGGVAAAIEIGNNSTFASATQAIKVAV